MRKRISNLGTMTHSTQIDDSNYLYIFCFFFDSYMCLHALVIKEITSLIFIIWVFIFSYLSFPFSLLPLHPTIFDHYGMKNITEPYVNSWSYQCKFLTFFREGKFLACTISLCDVFIFPNAAVCLMVYFAGHCPQIIEMHDNCPYWCSVPSPAI